MDSDHVVVGMADHMVRGVRTDTGSATRGPPCSHQVRICESSRRTISCCRGDEVRRHLSAHRAIVARRLQRMRAAMDAAQAVEARRAAADRAAMAARFDPVVQAANRAQCGLIARYLATYACEQAVAA